MLVSNDRLEERMHSEFLDRLLSGEINHDDSAYRQSMEKYGLLGKKPWQLLIINLMKISTDRESGIS